MNEIEVDENGKPPETAVAPNKGTEEARPRRWNLILIAIIFLLLAGLAIGLGVGLTRGSSTSAASAASGVEGVDAQSIPNASPTLPPVVDDTNVPATTPPVANVPATTPPVANVPATTPPVANVPATTPPVVEEPVLDVTPFISEFHYDNVGGDEDHAIEIAAPYGLDVSNLIVEFYRDDGTVYLAQSLADFKHGTTSGGLAFWSMQLDTMLNGPNGIALGTDQSSGFELIEFISYEGIIEGTQGIATGATSVDIGVAEGDDTPVGFSLQKGGEGCNGGDFEWQAATFAETAGSVNEGMTVTCGGVDATAPPTPTPVCSLKVLTADEVSEHAFEDDLWLILFGTVYDLTYYAPTHKGTAQVIYNVAGQDATAQFESALALDHHHTEGKLYRTFRNNIVGIVGDESGEIVIDCDESLRDYSPFTSQ